MSYNWYADNIECLQKYFTADNIDYPGDYACFSDFGSHFNPEHTYIGNNVDKETAYKFAEDFNKLFKNIQMKIVLSTEFYVIENSYYGPKYKHESAIGIKELSIARKQPFTVFTLEFNEAYTPILKSIIYVTVGELLRAYSPYYFKDKITRKNNLVIDSLYYSFANHKSYGLCYLTTGKVDYFLALDNPELMNQLINEEKVYTIADVHYSNVYNYRFSICKMNHPTAALVIIKNYFNDPEVLEYDYLNYFHVGNRIINRNNRFDEIILPLKKEKENA